MLEAFVPDECINQISPLAKKRPVTGPVLDIDSMKNLLKDEELIKDCLNLMVTGIEKDLIKLPYLHQTADWQIIREIAHKWQGASSYCGANRLEQACMHLVDYLWENGPGKRANSLYQQLTQEMETAKTVCEDYIKKTK